MPRVTLHCISASPLSLSSVLTVCGTGTPSDLLPVELRPCHYESGSQGKIVRMLTDPAIVTPLRLSEAQHAEPRQLLHMVATHDPPFHALIDVGAAIVGLSNRQAVEYMLEVRLRDTARDEMQPIYSRDTAEM